MKRLKVGAKLYSVMALLTLATVIIAYIGVSRMATIQGNLQYIMDYNMVQLSDNQRMREAIGNMIRMQKNTILAPTDEQSKEFADKSKGFEAEANQIFAKIMDSYAKDPRASDEERATLKRFDEPWRNYCTLNRQILDLAVQNTNNKLMLLLTQQIIPDMEQLNQALLAMATADAATSASAAATQALSLTQGVVPALVEHNNTSDPKQMDDIEQKLKADGTQLTALLAQLGQGAKDQAALDQAKARWTAVQKAMAQGFEYSRANTNTASTNLSLTSGISQYAKVTEVMQAIDAMIAKNNETQTKLGAAMYRQARQGMLLITALGLIASLTLATFIIRGILQPINKTVATLKDIAQGEGDLTRRVPVTSNDEIGELATWFNTFVEKLQKIIVDVGMMAQNVASAANEIAASSEQMAQGMVHQTDQTTQVSAAVEQMSSNVVEVARKSGEASNTAHEAGAHAVGGGQVIDKTIAGIRSVADVVNESTRAITRLGQRGEEIGQIIKVINDIADQTNLLALNAAIEAARAGEHGRGFSVVADEVRKLAERTTHATHEVAESIKAIQQETHQAVESVNLGSTKVAEGVSLAENAGVALDSIVKGAEAVSGMIQAIAAASEEQSATAEQIARNIEAIASVTRESSQGAAQAAEAATQLSQQSVLLQQLVAQFKVA